MWHEVSLDCLILNLNRVIFFQPELMRYGTVRHQFI